MCFKVTHGSFQADVVGLITTRICIPFLVTASTHVIGNTETSPFIPSITAQLSTNKRELPYRTAIRVLAASVLSYFKHVYPNDFAAEFVQLE